MSLCVERVYSQRSIGFPVHCFRGDGLLPGRRSVLLSHQQQQLQSSAAIQNSSWFVEYIL